MTRVKFIFEIRNLRVDLSGGGKQKSEGALSLKEPLLWISVLRIPGWGECVPSDE